MNASSKVGTRDRLSIVSSEGAVRDIAFVGLITPDLRIVQSEIVVYSNVVESVVRKARSSSSITPGSPTTRPQISLFHGSIAGLSGSRWISLIRRII